MLRVSVCGRTRNLWLDVPFVRNRKTAAARPASPWSCSIGKRHQASPSSPCRIRRRYFRTPCIPAEAHGIYASAMVRYFQQNGFRTFALAGQPQISNTNWRAAVRSSQRSNRNPASSLHYVVVVGLDQPERSCSSTIPRSANCSKKTNSQFEREWKATGTGLCSLFRKRARIEPLCGAWIDVLLLFVTGGLLLHRANVAASISIRPATPATCRRATLERNRTPPANIACRAAAETDYYLGIALAHLGRLPRRKAELEAGQRLAPTDPRFPVELAGVAFQAKKLSRKRFSVCARRFALRPTTATPTTFSAPPIFLKAISKPH